MKIEKKVRLLTLFAILTITSCATAPDPAIGFPPRPDFLPIPDTVWAATPLEVQDIMILNMFACQEYVLKAEGRIRLHDNNRN